MDDEGEPVCIVQKEQQEDGGGFIFRLNEEALNSILSHNSLYNKKVAIVSVVGAYRTGKSFLLSFFQRYLQYGGRKDWILGDNAEDLTRLKGFHWARGIEGVTLGVWVWSKPYIVNMDGEEIAVLLMDTQGTFDVDSDEQESTFVLAFSTMISSVQIFNLKERLQSNDLDHLHYCTSYGMLAMEETGRQPFQQLGFLIRDWSHSDEYAFGGFGGEKYLQSILNKAKAKPQSQTKEVCDHLDRCFDEVSCFLLPTPGERANSYVDFKGALSQIEGNFKIKVKELCARLFSPQHIAVKMVNGQAITCGALFGYCQTWIEKLNSRDMPVPHSIHMLASENICRNAYSLAVNEYTISMENQCRYTIYSDEELQEHSEVFAAASLMIFDNVPKLGRERAPKSMEYRNSVLTEITRLFEGFRRSNEDRRSSQNWKRVAIGAGGVVLAGAAVGAAAVVIGPAAVAAGSAASAAGAAEAASVVAVEGAAASAGAGAVALNMGAQAAKAVAGYAVGRMGLRFP